MPTLWYVKQVEPLQPNFGIRIRLLRDRAGLSQKQLAEACEISVDQISNIERGKHFASETTIALLATALGVPSISLFDNSENEAFIKKGGMKRRAQRSKSALIVRKGKVEMSISSSKRNPKRAGR